MDRPMTARDLGHEAFQAMEAVAAGIGVARRVEREAAAGALIKVDASPVTVADFSVQALVGARLAREFPGDPLLAEEDASALRAAGAADVMARALGFVREVDTAIGPVEARRSFDRASAGAGPRFWVLDPIDGTKGLLRGGQYAIALALIVNDVVQVGVVGCPRLSLAQGSAPSADAAAGGLAVAVRGRGAWWSTGAGGVLAALRVSDVGDPARARVLHSVEAPHSDVARFRRAIENLGASRPPILMDSQAKHVVLASGGADILLRFPPREGFHDAVWDQAAGSILIEEAGGRVTDLAGRQLDFSAGPRLSRNTGLAASNGPLHEALLAAVREAMARVRHDPR
jgi:3'(2'), 5'-bisphosphate nucleotidase